MREGQDAVVAEVGTTANNYQILGRLATGGMAEIFLARGMSATGVERHCVLKRILRHRASDVSFVRMFLDEARLAAQLQHPNVAQVYDIGKLGDSYFFTMEYVHGETVRAILQRARSLRREVPLASVLTIITGAAAGLHHAHERIGIDGRPLDIVHRDVSPSNLMVSYEGGVKVVDFGVAKAADRAHETRSGTVKGKISYLSPEQARGSSHIDRRSDLFSLGIVLWEMLTTERLYKRSSDFENMTAIVTEPPPPPSSRRKWIPPELDAIALRLLAKNPAERFQTADDLIEAVERFAGRSGTMISSSALARFLRDMFGQRPEPWVEIDQAEVPDGVTVTSEPIPGELAIAVEEDMDLQLAHVPKLVREQPPIPRDELPTTPHPLVTPADVDTQYELPPPPMPRYDPASMTLAGTGVGSGPQSRLPQTPPMGMVPITVDSVSSQMSYPRALPLEERVERRRNGWQIVAVIVVAALIGSATMWFVMKGRGGTEAPADAAAIAEVTVDAAAIESPPVVDAAVVELAVDAAIDAAVVAVEIDAAIEVVVVDAAVVAPDAPPKKEKRPKKTDDDPVALVLAACRASQTAKARALFAKLERSKRRSVLGACKNAGVDLEPEQRPKQDPCEVDPMSCQH